MAEHSMKGMLLSISLRRCIIRALTNEAQGAAGGVGPVLALLDDPEPPPLCAALASS